MSAGPSPSNPSQPKHPTGPPRPSTFRRALPSLLVGGTALTLLWAYFSARPAPAPNPFRTPGVKNIEGSYRGGGATGSHTPAYGGTKQGQRDSESFRGDGERNSEGNGSPVMQSAGKREFNVPGPNGTRDGPGGQSWDIGEMQRPPGGQSIGVGKKWNEMKYGHKDQK